MSISKITSVKIKKVSSMNWLEADDFLAVEEPLEIQLEFGERSYTTTSIAVTMRTPGNDLELAAGFLFTEGIIRNKKQITGHHIDESGNKIRITLAAGEAPALNQSSRNFYTTSSCGVCGKASIDAIKMASPFSIVKNSVQVDEIIIQRLESSLATQQAAFLKTGGLHAAALFDLGGSSIALREDVGRHNALDKLIGDAFLEDRLPLSEKILLLSGRASFELIQKAWMAGIPIVAAVGAPSSMAVSLAEEAGITLVGFLRNNRFNIYCGAERIRVHSS